MSLDLPAPLRINCKLIEHALSEFSKYVRFSKQPPTKDWKSRAFLDQLAECIMCSSPRVEDKLFCLLYNRLFHAGCLTYKVNKVEKLSFICDACQQIKGLVLPQA